MARSDLERMIDEWAAAWSSHDAERLAALLIDDCMFEDVTFDVVTRGKDELRGLANGAFTCDPGRHI